MFIVRVVLWLWENKYLSYLENCLGSELVGLHVTCAVLDSRIVFLPTCDGSSCLHTYSLYSYNSCILCVWILCHLHTHLLTTTISTYTSIVDASLVCACLAGQFGCRRSAWVLDESGVVEERQCMSGGRKAVVGLGTANCRVTGGRLRLEVLCQH